MYESGPIDGRRQLAAVDDAELATEVREALIAVVLWGDAWRATLPRTVERYDRSRVALLDALRIELCLASKAATVEQLAALAAPIINPFWPGSTDLAATLGEAVEALRYLVMHRLSHIRAELARSEATHP
jgi:hypothetical protein